MYALAVPTFYMPFAYLVVAVWAIAGIFIENSNPLPEWIRMMLLPSIYVTFCLWPLYLIWVVFCKKLNAKEKIWWVFIIFFLNMIGMPMFYVFITRRYLGLEGNIQAKDEASLESLLNRNSIDRGQLNAEQIDLLKSYCRKNRLAKLSAFPMIIVSLLCMYTAVFFFPKHCIKIFSDFTPTRTVIINSQTDEKEEIVPDPDAIELHIKNLLMMGAMAGMIGAMGMFVLTQAIPLLVGNWHRKTFIDFIKVTRKE